LNEVENGMIDFDDDVSTKAVSRMIEMSAKCESWVKKVMVHV